MAATEFQPQSNWPLLSKRKSIENFIKNMTFGNDISQIQSPLCGRSLQRVSNVKGSKHMTRTSQVWEKPGEGPGRKSMHLAYSIGITRFQIGTSMTKGMHEI